MALIDSVWYCNFGDGSTTGHYAVAKRPQNTAVAAGQIVRQFTAPSVGNERVFICIIAGTTANVTDATWVLTRGAKTTDGTATWMECSGQAGLNGDLTNTQTWAQAKAATPAVLGQVIKRSNNASYQICTTAGAMSASEPAFSDTAGVTTTDTTAVWTSLGVVGNFTGGQAPHARLANALATNWFASGNTVYVGDNHAETQASNMTMSPSSALLAKILCHNHSGSYPPAAGDITTGATITASGVFAINLQAQGSFYFYGLVFQAGTSSLNIGPSAVGQVQNWYYFDTCSLQSTANVVNSIVLGAQSTAWGIVVFNNTTVKFSGTSSSIIPYFCQLTWQNTGQILVSGSSVPITLFQAGNASGRFNNITLNNLDLSQLTGSLFSNASNSSIGTLVVQDCKLNAAMTVTTPINTGMNVQLIRSDSAGTSYKSTRYNYEGTETTETSIVRTGGAVDPTGQAQSRKIATSANAQWLRPFKAEPMVIWNAVTGTNRVVTVCGTVNAGALPNNDDIWLEAEYLSDSGSPLGKIVTTTKSSVLASNAAVSADSSVWSNVAPSTTLDGTTVDATMSNGNLTATHSLASSNSGVVSTKIITGSKWYWEATFTTTHGLADCMAIALTGATFANVVTNGTNCVAVYIGTGNIWSNNVSTGKSFGAMAAGTVVGLAIDFDNRLAWFRKIIGGTTSNWNNDPAADPATGAGGVTVGVGATAAPFVGFGGASTAINDKITANFGQSAYAMAKPSGFGDWNGYVPFKLSATLSAPQPQLAGYLHARVRVAKASTTYYIDPQVTLT